MTLEDKIKNKKKGLKPIEVSEEVVIPFPLYITRMALQKAFDYGRIYDLLELGIKSGFCKDKERLEQSAPVCIVDTPYGKGEKNAKPEHSGDNIGVYELYGLLVALRGEDLVTDVILAHGQNNNSYSHTQVSASDIAKARLELPPEKDIIGWWHRHPLYGSSAEDKGNNKKVLVSIGASRNKMVRRKVKNNTVIGKIENGKLILEDKHNNRKIEIKLAELANDKNITLEKIEFIEETPLRYAYGFSLPFYNRTGKVYCEFYGKNLKELEKEFQEEEPAKKGLFSYFSPQKEINIDLKQVDYIVVDIENDIKYSYEDLAIDVLRKIKLNCSIEDALKKAEGILDVEKIREAVKDLIEEEKKLKKKKDLEEKLKEKEILFVSIPEKMPTNLSMPEKEGRFGGLFGKEDKIKEEEKAYVYEITWTPVQEMPLLAELFELIFSPKAFQEYSSKLEYQKKVKAFNEKVKYLQEKNVKIEKRYVYYDAELDFIAISDKLLPPSEVKEFIHNEFKKNQMYLTKQDVPEASINSITDKIIEKYKLIEQENLKKENEAKFNTKKITNREEKEVVKVKPEAVVEKTEAELRKNSDSGDE